MRIQIEGLPHSSKVSTWIYLRIFHENSTFILFQMSFYNGWVNNQISTKLFDTSIHHPFDSFKWQTIKSRMESRMGYWSCHLLKIVYLLRYFVSYCLNLFEDKTIKQSKYHKSFSKKNIRKILKMNFFRQRLSSSSVSSSSAAMEESMTHHSQQRRLANPNLVFLKRKNEREKRIMEDNSLIFGFENPSRSLCPITADPDNVKFLGMTFFGWF